jgi:hypothetical protein
MSLCLRKLTIEAVDMGPPGCFECSINKVEVQRLKLQRGGAFHEKYQRRYG